MSRTGWRTPAVILVCGGVILMLALGTRQSFGLFLRPMSLDLGWGREAFSFAIALQNLVWGLAMPFAGTPPATVNEPPTNKRAGAEPAPSSSNTANACTAGALFEPETPPADCQLDPFQRAMPLADTPPAVVKNPPA